MFISWLLIVSDRNRLITCSIHSQVVSKPYQAASSAESTKLCNHKRKLLATLQSKAQSPATSPPPTQDQKKGKFEHIYIAISLMYDFVWCRHLVIKYQEANFQGSSESKYDRHFWHLIVYDCVSPVQFALQCSNQFHVRFEGFVWCECLIWSLCS